MLRLGCVGPNGPAFSRTSSRDGRAGRSQPPPVQPGRRDRARRRRIVVSSIRSSVRLDPTSFAILGGDSTWRPARRILADLAGPGATPEVVERVRACVTHLLRAGILFLDPWPEDVTRTPARAESAARAVASR